MPRNLILGRDVIIITNNVYIKCGLVFGFKLDVISFINIYGK
jgi:hypothetical protein